MVYTGLGAWLYGVHRTWSMVVWCTQDLRRDGAVSTPLLWIFNNNKKRAIKLVTHAEPHASAVSLLKRAENSAI